MHFGPGSLAFHPPGAVYGDRISDAGSRCFTIAIEPGVFLDAVEAMPALGPLDAPRSGPPSWLAYQLRAELDVGGDLSSTSVESTVLALLAELGGRPGLEGRGAPPPWLARVAEQIHDEFARGLTLASLAETAGVHRVHVARAFRQHYGCTAGDYIRQRRVEFACHRLIGSDDRLSDVAFDAGFADQSHLTNTFRRLVGLTPGAFRARFRHQLRPAVTAEYPGSQRTDHERVIAERRSPRSPQ
jgi:AraC family transcriptional regulator